MRVLLLGATGNLGSRLVPALIAHHHEVVVLIRSRSKLEALFTEPLLSSLAAIVIGDATSSASIKNALVRYEIEGIVDVAGNQVAPGQEFLMPKIAKAVTDAAIEVGKEREAEGGRVLRAWICCGMGVLRYGEGTDWRLDDLLPARATDQHAATDLVVSPIPTTSLSWSLICVAMMRPSNRYQTVFSLLDSPHPHNLKLKAGSPPDWKPSWVRYWVPVIGIYLDLIWRVLMEYETTYEDVAEFLAGDLERGGEEWVGKKVGMKEKERSEKGVWVGFRRVWRVLNRPRPVPASN